MQAISFSIIGKVSCTRKEATDDLWSQETTFIELDPHQFSTEALLGLDSFSHIEILFFMNQAAEFDPAMQSRRPRDNPAWPKVGIFAQRARNRPNRIGTTVARLVRVEGLKIYLQGLDAIDGTPVLDIKPWVNEFGPLGKVQQPDWMTELMQRYWD